MLPVMSAYSKEARKLASIPKHKNAYECMETAVGQLSDTQQLMNAIIWTMNYTEIFLFTADSPSEERKLMQRQWRSLAYITIKTFFPLWLSLL